MRNYNFENIEIKAMAATVPDDCEQLMDFSSLLPEGEMEKFCQTTGIYQRYAGHHKKVIASDLCVVAAEHIFRKFPELKSKIDALVFMSQSFDYSSPATAGVIQMRLGLDQCGVAYDITYGCAAFPFGLQIAGSFISGGCQNVLLLIGDNGTAPEIKDKDDLLFGDAGCAIVVGRMDCGSERIPGGIQIRLETIGSKYQALMFPFGANRHRYYDIVAEVGEENASKLLGRYMNGPDVFTFSIKDTPRAVKRFYEDFHCDADDFDFAAIHQANRMIVDNVAKRIQFKKEKVPIAMDRYANTNGVSVPITICDFFERTSAAGIKRVLSVAFGIGMSIGVCSCYIDSAVCLPIIKTDKSYDDGIDYQEFLLKRCR